MLRSSVARQQCAGLELAVGLFRVGSVTAGRLRTLHYAKISFCVGLFAPRYRYFWLWRWNKLTCFILRTCVCAKRTTDVTFSACGISKSIQRSHLTSPSLQNPTVTTRWSHLQPWPRSRIVPLPHPARPCHPRPHPPRPPLLPPYLPWLHTCPFQPCTGCWRMERGHRRRRLAVLRLHRTPSAGWWVSLGWDTDSSSPDFWRWENGDWNWK